MPRSTASLLPLASNHNHHHHNHPTPAFRTMEDMDTARVPPLANVDTYWHALKAIERITVPHAAQEQREVETFLDRKRRGLAVGDSVTAFHSTTLPAIAFADYATLVAERTGYGREGVAVGLALMARYAVATKRGITPLSMHRLFATCMQVGMKATCDAFVKNVYIAAVVGMTAPELNSLEVLLLHGISYRAVPSPAAFSALPCALEALPVHATSSDLFSVLSRFCGSEAGNVGGPPSARPPPPVGDAATHSHENAPAPPLSPVMPLLELAHMGGDDYDRRDHHAPSSLTAHPIPNATASVSTVDGAYNARPRGGGFSSTTAPATVQDSYAAIDGPSFGA